MTRTVITTGNAPALAAPLSQGIRKGPVLQVSGLLLPAARLGRRAPRHGCGPWLVVWSVYLIPEGNRWRIDQHNTALNTGRANPTDRCRVCHWDVCPGRVPAPSSPHLLSLWRDNDLHRRQSDQRAARGRRKPGWPPSGSSGAAGRPGAGSAVGFHPARLPAVAALRRPGAGLPLALAASSHGSGPLPEGGRPMRLTFTAAGRGAVPVFARPA
ncbi:DUF6083 domain-containing protein [Kitasatospora sp. NPDC018619]|uniref:DUF6083 domain-containing protein n=1 Tax=unclassified Kitasatospora TaxID=2633591 RepID=UPI00378C1A5F